MKNKILFGAIALTYSAFSLAASPDGYMTDSGVSITPIIDAGIKYDDNIFSESSGTTGSSIFTVAPAVRFSLDDGINNYNLDIGLESGTYLDSRDDDYITGNLGFKSHLEASSRSRFDIQLEARKEVEPRGTGLTEGIGDTVTEPLTYDDQIALLTYEYGSLSSKGRIAFTGKYYNKSYTNFTNVTSTRSFNEPSLGSTFYYSTNASTDAFFEIKGSTISYEKNTGISSDSDSFSALVGVKWEATALTSGSFKIGQAQKNFTNDAREDFKGISWDGKINWKPLTYTTLTFTTSRSAKDPDGLGDYIDETLSGLNWSHTWNDFISSNVSYRYTDEDYTGVERNDRTNNIFLDVNYQFLIGSSVAFFVEYTDKDSTYENVIYDKKIIGINFTQYL